MITPKNLVGSRKIGPFLNSKRLITTPDNSSLKKWSLINDHVTFNFIEDPVTGVRLDSWKTNDGEYTYNKSRNLWQINTIISYGSDSLNGAFHTTHVSVYPSHKKFQVPSQVPIQSENKKAFNFVWTDVKYDIKRPEFGAIVLLDVSLENDSFSLDIKLTTYSTQSYNTEDLKLSKSSVVAAIHFPSIVISKDEDETVNDDFVLSAPIAVGYTYYNPFKYLRSPRFDEESFQYSDKKTRCYAGSFIGFPLSSRHKYNFGSPGGLSMPALVIGNKRTKNGTLIYGMDQEGSNPKGFQWYSDGENLLIHTYHNSDHQVDPYGIGGYNDEETPYSIYNSPSWSLRIRPFKSETTWVDWKGFDVFREEAVKEQEAYGWMPKSLYERQLSGEISKKAAEIPLVLNVYGYTTGNLNSMLSSLNYYKQVYKECVNPNLEDPYIPMHYQTVTLNATPSSISISGNPGSTYNGWQTWAGSGYALMGPDIFKSPDYAVNEKHKTIYSGIFDSNGILYSYDLFSFIVSTGSIWTTTHSGIDLGTKSIYNEDKTFTNDDYSIYAKSGTLPTIFNFDSWQSCVSTEICRDKNKQYKKELYSSKMGTYNDTLGNFGRGCFAKNHKYYDPDSDTTMYATHPRAGYSKYYNDAQLNWIKDQKNLMEQAYIENGFTGISINDWQFASAPEFPNDVLLQFSPLAPFYEPLGPILNYFVNSFSNPREDAILNLSVLGPTVDGLSDGDISTLLSTYPWMEYWRCYIKQPNWIQRCPSFQIAYSDRSIAYEWAGVYSTNVFDYYFNSNVITGIGAYNQNLTRPQTNSEQEAAWAAFSATMWPYSNRMSMWHVDSQIDFVAPTLTGIQDDASIVHSSIKWSGLFNNFNKVQLRLQAYCPDFIYHGSIQHPLEEWTSENYMSGQLVDQYILLKSALSSCLNPYSGNPGIETTPHFVRKNRNGNYLIGIYNWYSGTSSFSGVFDPEKYGLDNGYQVYSLDLTSAEHGTKTLIDIKNPLETKEISLSLDKYDFVIYEIEANNTILDKSVFSDLVSDYANVRYSYSQTPVTSHEYSFVYSYSPLNISNLEDPMIGRLAPATQQILNNLPQWTRVRQDRDSNGWKLANSWGISFEEVINTVSTNVQNNYLITSDSSLLNKLSYIDVNKKELLENKKRNVLFNSGFEIKDISIKGSPAGWQNSLESPLVLNNKESGINSTCIRSTGKTRISQTIFFNNTSVNTLTGSIYFKSNANNVSAKLIIAIEKIDGTSIIQQAVLSNRSTEWIRLVLPIQIYAQIYKVNFIVKTDCDGDVCIAAPQLEIGSLTNWTSSNKDVRPYLPYSSPFNSVFTVGEEYHSNKINLVYIGNEQEFLKADVPTRVEKTSKPVKNLNLYVNKKTGRRVSFHNEIISTEYVVQEGKIKERSALNEWDVYASYGIRDLRYYEEFSYGTKEVSENTIIPLALAVRKDWLFVACKETIKNNTIRTLKIVKPIITPNGETYLESVCDFNLNLNFDSIYGLNQIQEEISEIYLSEIDPSCLVISTTNNVKKYYKLYFDYYYFNTLNNRLYTIEEYPNQKINII